MNGAAQTVGVNLRRLRLARGLSLVELGRLSGLAKGTLTQLEAGRANPTIDTLQSLARALGAEIGELVAEAPAQGVEVVRADEGPVTPGRTLTGRLISRSHLGSMIVELFSIRLAAASMHHAQSHAAGVVEYLYVISGTVETGPDGETVVLGPGDFARFPADRPHCYGAPAEEAHALLSLMFPTMPQPAAAMSLESGAIGAVEGLVRRPPLLLEDPLGVVERPAEPPADPPAPVTRELPQPPVRGRRPTSRTVPGPTPGRPRPPGPGR